jgi:hypothetical protein
MNFSDRLAPFEPAPFRNPSGQAGQSDLLLQQLVVSTSEIAPATARKRRKLRGALAGCA